MKKIFIIIGVALIPAVIIVGGLYLFGNIKKDNMIEEALENINDPSLVQESEIKENGNDKKSCVRDSDCVPATCCHATEVVNKKYAPKCDEMVCTMSCETILDCGQGRPVCSAGVCSIKIQ